MSGYVDVYQLDCQNRISGLYTSCAPSPRTVARSSKRIGRSSNYRPFDNDSNNGGGDDGSSDTGLFYKPRRSQPIVHPPSEVPFCENCRALDEEMSREYNSQTGSPVHNITDDLLTHDDEEESRSWVMKMPPGPWWCEDCQESVTSTNLTISQLFAILRQWTPYAQLQLITIVEEIFRRGAHVDDRDGLTDMTLLHFAAKSGALGDEQSACRIANYLLDEGANLEARCKLTDMTPLHYAAYFDCPLIADLLILRGACINARSFLIDNATPLHLAASQLSLGTARILIQAADFSVTKTGQRYDAKDAKDGLGRTPYECLPPSGQLPEPLCTLRDLLSELLRPTTPHQSESIDIEKTILKATSSDPSDYRSDKTTNSIDHPVGEVKYTDGYATSRPTELRQHQQQAQSACNGVDWLVAESGYLSPRTTKVQSVLQTPDNIKTKRPTTLQSSSNNARPSSASSKCSISAKVTLQSLGLSLGDRVCIAPGNSTPTSSSASASVSSKAHPTTPTGISGRIGKLRFCGSVSFASGVWVGVELDEPVGRNNGSVAGVKYFTCPNQHGIFAPIGRVYKTVNVNGKTNWHPIATSIATTTTASSSSSTTHSGVVKRSSVSSTPNTLRKLNNLNEEADEEEAASTPVKRLPSSRSSYSISSTTASLHHQCPSTASEHQHQRTPTPTGMQSPINLSHVTAKIDTGLRIRSPDISQRSQQQLLQLGDRVLVAGQRRGILRFIGETQFAPGVWYGVELEQPVGKNNGSINGVRYFDCAVGHGIFAPVNRIQKLPSRSNTPNPHCATMANRRDTLMSTSYHSEMADGGYSASRSFSRTPWSSTTSPMIGRAVIGRPPLPTELMNALKAVGRMPTTESTADEPVFYLAEGMQVLCAGEIGIVRYIGPITFADGIWLGIELRKPRGRHDGCVAGKRYFTCRPGHGLLVRPARVFCHGINAVNLLPPALAELERQLAAKRQEANSNRSNKVSSTTSISSGDEQSQQQK
uniref:CAP-Gly domain-containing protein n=1 Tax=Trichobilharzia regenti TaxID=157069 RepID=A0AA85J031_TRIRE|nr:unnamed protein product [Trichobilharzia regenti]